MEHTLISFMGTFGFVLIAAGIVIPIWSLKADDRAVMALLGALLILCGMILVYVVYRLNLPTEMPQVPMKQTFLQQQVKPRPPSVAFVICGVSQTKFERF